MSRLAELRQARQDRARIRRSCRRHPAAKFNRAWRSQRSSARASESDESRARTKDRLAYSSGAALSRSQAKRCSQGPQGSPIDQMRARRCRAFPPRRLREPACPANGFRVHARPASPRALKSLRTALIRVNVPRSDAEITTDAAIAQSVEHIIRNDGVGGSKSLLRHQQNQWLGRQSPFGALPVSAGCPQCPCGAASERAGIEARVSEGELLPSRLSFVAVNADRSARESVVIGAVA